MSDSILNSLIELPFCAYILISIIGFLYLVILFIIAFRPLRLAQPNRTDIETAIQIVLIIGLLIIIPLIIWGDVFPN